MRAICWEADQEPDPKYIAFVRNVVDVVRGLVSYALSVHNRCVLLGNRYKE